MSYHLSYKNNGYFLTHTGIITIKEIHQANGLIHGHEEFDSHQYQVINLLNADFSEISQNKSIEPAVTDLAASETRPNVNVALIARETKAVNFCIDYITESKQLGSQWDFEIFSDLTSALEWCGS